MSEAKINVPFVSNFYEMGIQDFHYPYQYDCIWHFWIFMYISDNDMIDTLQKSAKALSPGGLIFVKENVQHDVDSILVNRERYTVVRSKKHYRLAFDAAGLEIIHDEKSPFNPAFYDL